MHQSVLRNMSDVARAIALPGESPPVRFPSYPALERTALMRFNAPKTWSLQSSGGPTRRVILTRQAAFPLWVEEEQREITPFSYQAGWITDIRVNADPQLDVYTRLDYLASGPTPLVTGRPRVTGVVPPPGFYPPVGSDLRSGPVPFVWIPRNASAYLVIIPVTATATATPILANCELWLPSGETRGYTAPVVTMNANSLGVISEITAATYGIDGAGVWFRPHNISINVPTGPPAQYRLTVVVVTSPSGITIVENSTTNPPTINIAGSIFLPNLLPAVVPNEFAVSHIPWVSTRCTAVSALFTNITKVLNKEGSVQWGRLNPDQTDVWNFTPSTLQVLHPTEKAFMALETGTYTFVPPSTDQANFWDHTVIVGTTPWPQYRLDNTALVCAGVFTDPDGDTTLAINVDWHLEFRNTSALFPIGLSTMTLESFHQAQLALVQSGFFYQNETHKTILSRVLAAVKKFVPQVLSLHPVGRAAVNAYRAVKRSPPKQPRQQRRKKQQKQPPPQRKKKGGLQMYLDSRASVAPRPGMSRPKSTSGRASGFR